MLFKSEPNLYVKISNKYVHRVTGIKGFYFDDKGYFETGNELLAKLLAQNFEEVKELMPFEETCQTEEEIKIDKVENKKIENKIPKSAPKKRRK